MSIRRAVVVFSVGVLFTEAGHAEDGVLIEPDPVAVVAPAVRKPGPPPNVEPAEAKPPPPADGDVLIDGASALRDDDGLYEGDREDEQSYYVSTRVSPGASPIRIRLCYCDFSAKPDTGYYEEPVYGCAFDDALTPGIDKTRINPFDRFHETLTFKPGRIEEDRLTGTCVAVFWGNELVECPAGAARAETHSLIPKCERSDPKIGADGSVSYTCAAVPRSWTVFPPARPDFIKQSIAPFFQTCRQPEVIRSCGTILQADSPGALPVASEDQCMYSFCQVRMGANRDAEPNVYSYSCHGSLTARHAVTAE